MLRRFDARDRHPGEIFLRFSEETVRFIHAAEMRIGGRSAIQRVGWKFGLLARAREPQASASS